MNIIVTGAARGIGFELVKKFASIDGAHILALSRNAKSLEELLAYCKNNHPNAQVLVLPIDLSSTSAFPIIKEFVTEHFSHVDILVNNAGAIVNKDFLGINDEELELALAVNYKAVFKMAQVLFPFLKKSAQAHMVNISSMGGFQGSAKFKGLSAYSASKGAVAILTECLAEEFKDDNIKVNCLALGAVNTEMLKAAFPGYEAPINADAMAEYIADFARNAGKVMNGKIIPLSLSTP